MAKEVYRITLCLCLLFHQCTFNSSALVPNTTVSNKNVTDNYFDDPGIKVTRTRIQTFDYLTLDVEKDVRAENVLQNTEGMALTKCAERCVRKTNCETINFHFENMICELVGHGGVNAAGTTGWSHFKTLNWAKTTSDACEKRPCSGREVCVDLSSGAHACVLTRCDDPRLLPGASLSSNVFEIGKTLRYYCENNVSFTGDPLITCTDTGAWTNTAFECRCPEPPAVSGITVSSARVVGTTLKYRCNPPLLTRSHAATMLDTITCLSNGFWSDDPNVYCDCGQLPSIANAFVEYSSGSKIGGYARYQCHGYRWTGHQHVHFVPYGDANIYCTVSGWHRYSYFYCG